MKSFKRCGKDLIKKSDAVVDAVKKLKVMEEKLSSKLNITGGEGNQVVDAMQSSNSTTNESFRCNVPTNLHDQEGMDIGGHDYQPFYQHNCNESSLSDNEYRTNTSNENVSTIKSNEDGYVQNNVKDFLIQDISLNSIIQISKIEKESPNNFTYNSKIQQGDTKLFEGSDFTLQHFILTLASFLVSANLSLELSDRLLLIFFEVLRPNLNCKFPTDTYAFFKLVEKFPYTKKIYCDKCNHLCSDNDKECNKCHQSKLKVFIH